MIRRIAIVALVLSLLAPAAAFAQTNSQGGPFGPLPPAQPTPAPTPQQSNDDNSISDSVGSNTLYVIAGALLIAFIAIGVFISRDARRALPKEARGDRRRLRDEGPHRHQRQAKAKARARGKAQRAARRRNR
jgi:hypothetical protein